MIIRRKVLGLILPVFVLSTVMAGATDGPAPVVSPAKSFTITQSFDGSKGWTSRIAFKAPAVADVVLEPCPWPADYSISPDEKWILRIQKTGSGDNVAILSSVAAAGKVTEVPGFNDSLWTASDAGSRLKWLQLYHAQITSPVWRKGGDILELQLRGSNIAKSGDGMANLVLYDVKKGAVVSVSPIQP